MKLIIVENLTKENIKIFNNKWIFYSETVSLISLSQAIFIIQCYYNFSYYILALLISNLFFFVVFLNNKIIIDYGKLFTAILITVGSSFLTLIYGKPLSAICYLLLLFIPIYFSNKYTFRHFSNIFIFINFLSLIFYLLSLNGFIEYFNVDVEGRFYNVYVLTLSDFLISLDSNNLQALRFYGVADEPGRLGVFLAFILIADRFKLNLKNTLALIMGILTFSTTFFSLVFIYTVLYKYKYKFFINLFIISLILFFILFFNDSNFLSFLLYKFNFFSIDTIINRFHDFHFYGDISSFSLTEILLGFSSNISDGEASIVSLFLKLGIFGIIFYIILLFHFRSIFIYLIPIVLVRYNFIFTDIVFLCAFLAYIDDIKNCPPHNPAS